MTLPLTRIGMLVTAPDTRSRLAAHAVVTVLLFWWIATGAIFVLERSDSTRALGLGLATALAVVGAALLRATRDDNTASGARRAFLGGALLWTLVQVAFYGGWLIGPAALRTAVPAEAPSLALASRAVASMLWYQLAMLGTIGIAVMLVGRHRNRTGLLALALFWAEHQIASVNIFLGVENPGRGFFPEALLFLESYFGPSRNSPLLLPSILLLAAIGVRAAMRAHRDREPAPRQTMLLVSVLAFLGVMELAVLGAPLRSELFDWAMTIRGF